MLGLKDVYIMPLYCAHENC